jgi:hypothetical protein
VREHLTGSVLVATNDLSDAVSARAVWAEDDLALPDTPGNRPQGAAGETCTDLGLVGVGCQKNRNELLAERAEFIGELAAQVLRDVCPCVRVCVVPWRRGRLMGDKRGRGSISGSVRFCGSAVKAWRAEAALLAGFILSATPLFGRRLEPAFA